MPYALFKFLVDHNRGIFLIYLKTMCASALNSNQEERQSTISSETLHPETPIQVHAARGGAMRTNLFCAECIFSFFHCTHNAQGWARTPDYTRQLVNARRNGHHANFP
jgi:hypothetical protein